MNQDRLPRILGVLAVTFASMMMLLAFLLVAAKIPH